MVLSQESIRSLLSQKIIPLPAYSYIFWGVISSAMMILTIFYTQLYEVLIILTTGCLLGIVLNWWCIARYNALYELYVFNKQQKDSIALLSFLLIFSICLTIFFSHNNTPVFITFVWMFAIGVFNYTIGSSFNKSSLFNYGLLLIVLAVFIFIGIMFMSASGSMDIHLWLSVLNIVILGFGHIALGIYYAIEQNRSLYAK